MALFGSVIPSDAQGGFSFRNKIINGQFDVWQRGTSFTSSSVNEYSADRFRTEGYAHSSVISRQTFTVGQTSVPGYPTYFCRVASSTTVSAGQFWAFQQRVEAPQVMSGSGTYTLSFWVKSTTSVAAGAFSYGIDGVQSTSPALSTTWQKLTTTVSISNNESTGYVSIYLVYFGPSKGNITVDIANVQLEYGSQATPFEKLPYSVELSKCQRYYSQLVGNYSPDWIVPNSSYTNYFTHCWQFPQEMRTGPTVSQISGTTVAMDQFGIGAATISSNQIGSVNQYYVRITVITSSPSSADPGTAISATGTFWQASSEL
jgi:hypothetical protein